MAKKAALSSKILVTNRAALVAKYKTSGVKAIVTAVRALTRADERRGFATRLIFLDGAPLKSKRVKDPADPVENKAAIDAVVRKHRPEYLVILGSHDVVPYQDLKNKLFDPNDDESDPDRFTQSDLPYACEAAYSQEVSKFFGPTRVVGRIPDLTGASSPGYLIRLLKSSATAKGQARPDSAFAISARIWEKSTKMSVRNILGSVPAVMLSPTAGPTFAPKRLREKIHFVNCHGDEDEHRFSGEGPEDTFETAMDSRKLTGVGKGTVAAFECCYGAQLYDPAGLPAMSIANAYLSKGAAGVVASTTIAYGPEDENANADIICQIFTEQVLRGASLGRAFLEARLAYVRQQSVADPYDEKTLAQFVLLGDPSLHPFPSAPPAPKSARAKGAEHAARLQRRVRLLKTGERLSRQTAYTVPAGRASRARAAVRSKVTKTLARRFKHIRKFEVREPAAGRESAGKALSSLPKAETVFVATKQRKETLRTRKTPVVDGLLMYQVDGNLVEIKLVSR
jgi:Peptidase family C25